MASSLLNTVNLNSPLVIYAEEELKLARSFEGKPLRHSFCVFFNSLHTGGAGVVSRWCCNCTRDLLDARKGPMRPAERARRELKSRCVAWAVLHAARKFFHAGPVHLVVATKHKDGRRHAA